MKKILTVIILSVILALQAFAQSADETAIRNLFEKSYINGAFNELDTVSMAQGFHPDFAIFSPEKDAIDKYPIAEWIANVSKRKPNKNREWVGDIKAIDITGKAAMAKIDLMQKKKLVFTDYFLLLKFESGWKIVAKVYNENGGKTEKVNPDDEKAIREMFAKNYFNGSFNGLDTVAMAQGFHPDFAMFSIGSGDSMGKYPIRKWIENIEKRKAAASFNPESFKRDCEVKSLDITGNSAVAKIQLSRKGETPTIDYILLLKFESGWKIVGKIFS
jgi:Putative lumazine-binding